MHNTRLEDWVAAKIARNSGFAPDLELLVTKLGTALQENAALREKAAVSAAAAIDVNANRCHEIGKDPRRRTCVLRSTETAASI